MVPTLLAIGLVAGVVCYRKPRILAAVLVVAAVLWTVVVTTGEANAGIVGAFLVGAANLIVGAAIGYGVGFAFSKGRESITSD